MNAPEYEVRADETQSEMLSLLDQIETLLSEVRERVVSEVLEDGG